MVCWRSNLRKGRRGLWRDVFVGLVAIEVLPVGFPPKPGLVLPSGAEHFSLIQCLRGHPYTYLLYPSQSLVGTFGCGLCGDLVKGIGNRFGEG